MQVSDPRIEAKLAHADELPALIVEATRIAYASRLRMVQDFTEALSRLLAAQKNACDWRMTIERLREVMQRPYRPAPSEAEIEALNDAMHHGSQAECDFEQIQQIFITQYAAENRLEVRF